MAECSIANHKNLHFVSRKPTIQFPKPRFASILRLPVNYISGQKGLGCTGFCCVGVETGVRVITGGRNLQNTVLRASDYEPVPPVLPSYSSSLQACVWYNQKHDTFSPTATIFYPTKLITCFGLYIYIHHQAEYTNKHKNLQLHMSENSELRDILYIQKYLTRICSPWENI
jgi:hypothetical protein